MDNFNNKGKYDAIDKFEYLFEAFWQEIEEFAKELGLHSSYVEEEFVIDGELIRVYPPAAPDLWTNEKNE